MQEHIRYPRKKLFGFRVLQYLGIELGLSLLGVLAYRYVPLLQMINHPGYILTLLIILIVVQIPFVKTSMFLVNKRAYYGVNLGVCALVAVISLLSSLASDFLVGYLFFPFTFFFAIFNISLPVSVLIVNAVFFLMVPIIRVTMRRKMIMDTIRHHL